MRSIWTMIVKAPGWALIGAVRAYQMLISPWLGPQCRFHPTCSQYMILAIQKYGVILGVPRGLWRICRCHPWNPGGEDFP